jgi:hypothetical protein
MRLDKAAGSCRLLNYRHRWGKERPLQYGVITVRKQQLCLDCDRVRVIAYTRRGNHVEGYFTK